MEFLFTQARMRVLSTLSANLAAIWFVAAASASTLVSFTAFSVGAIFWVWLAIVAEQILIDDYGY